MTFDHVESHLHYHYIHLIPMQAIFEYVLMEYYKCVLCSVYHLGFEVIFQKVPERFNPNAIIIVTSVFP